MTASPRASTESKEEQPPVRLKWRWLSNTPKCPPRSVCVCVCVCVTVCMCVCVSVCVFRSPHPQVEHPALGSIPKTIGNRKRDCAWGCARGINATFLQIAKHKSVRWAEWTPSSPGLCFAICRFFQVVFIPRAPNAQSLFLFPIVFGINLIHFFRSEEERCSRTFDGLFGSSITCRAIWQRQNEEWNILSTQSVNSAPFERGGANYKVKILARESANSSPISAILWRRHFRFSLSHTHTSHIIYQALPRFL